MGIKSDIPDVCKCKYNLKFQLLMQKTNKQKKKNICQSVYATSLINPLVPELNAQYEMQKTRT